MTERLTKRDAAVLARMAAKYGADRIVHAATAVAPRNAERRRPGRPPDHFLHSFLNVWIIVQVRAKARGPLMRGPRGGLISAEIRAVANDLRRYSEEFHNQASAIKDMYYDAEKLMRDHPSYRPYCDTVVSGVLSKLALADFPLSTLLALPFIYKRSGTEGSYKAVEICLADARDQFITIRSSDSIIGVIVRRPATVA